MQRFRVIAEDKWPLESSISQFREEKENVGKRPAQNSSLDLFNGPLF